MNDRVEEDTLVELGDLPEGWFFRPEYTPRFTVKAGVIRSVEFLRNEKEKSSSNEFGTLNIPLIEFPRIQQENSVELLSQAFHIPITESLDDLLQKATMKETYWKTQINKLNDFMSKTLITMRQVSSRYKDLLNKVASTSVDETLLENLQGEMEKLLHTAAKDEKKYLE